MSKSDRITVYLTHFDDRYIKISAQENNMSMSSLLRSCFHDWYWSHNDWLRTESDRYHELKEELADYLRRHENDIAHGINDFGDLKSLFKTCVGYLPEKEQ